MANPFLMYDNVFPLLSPADITGTATTTAYVDLRNAQAVGFLIAVGNVDGTTTDTEVITVQAASVPTGAEVAVPFWYRQSSALGTNAWGAVTSCASTGFSWAVGDDNKWLWIEVDPTELAAENIDYRYIRLVLTDTPDMANFLVSAVAFVQARYKNATMMSASAAASA